jgi:hypothetical protein
MLGALYGALSPSTEQAAQRRSEGIASRSDALSRSD